MGIILFETFELILKLSHLLELFLIIFYILLSLLLRFFLNWIDLY